ncbi:MAG TPA: magnesium transporter [Verrucomicrobiota bacterium]|nr:magnesium transporter [Verrucomicrobiota bacterium]
MNPAQPVFLEEFRNLHPADLADRLQRLTLEEAQQILTELPPALAGGAIAELERDRQHELLKTLPLQKLTPLLRALSADVIADLVPALPPSGRRQALESLPTENQQRVKALLRYAPDSAGGIMSDRFIALRDDMTVEQVRELLRAQAQEERTEDVAYLYVTDAQKRLVGIVSLRDLVFRRAERRMSEIMRREVKFLPVDADQEKTVQQFEHYHYLGLPVLDKEGRLVGVVKASDALEVAQTEATEDMQLMVGLSGEERSHTPWQTSIRHRLPWLYINLATALLAAFVVGLFESTIARWTALAVFLPIIAGQGGNAGMQTLTIIVRDLALGEISAGDGRRALVKELILGLINGAAVGVVVGLIGWWWKSSPALGIVAFVAMVLNQISAAFAGVAVPFGLKALRVDPALASSIFVTTVTDVAGFFFFLGLALLAMKYFGV